MYGCQVQVWVWVTCLDWDVDGGELGMRMGCWINKIYGKVQGKDVTALLNYI